MGRLWYLNVETPEERLARKVRSAFPEPSRLMMGSQKPYECKKCNRSFHCESSADRHLWYHLRREVSLWREPAPRGEEFQCGECGQQFRLSDTLLAHIRTHLSFPCTRRCRLVYPSKAALTQHALVRHSRRLLHDWYRDELAARLWKQPASEQ